jgi:hypothetical protein
MEGTASDNANAILRVEVSIDGGNTWRIAGGTTSWSYAVDSVGQWGIVTQPITIYIRATDTAPAKNQSTISVSYNLDNSALSGGGGNSFTNVGTITDNGGADDDRDAVDGNRDVSFSWTDVTNSVGYLIYVFEAETGVYDSYSADKAVGALANGGNTGISAVSLNTASGTTTFAFTGPSDGKKYYIQVKAYNAADNYSANWAVSSVIAVDISSPVSGTMSDPGSTSTSTTITFIWSGFSDSGGIAYYEVQSSDDNTNWSSPAQNVGLDTFVTTSGYGTETFENGETVYLRVRAVDSAGNPSGWQTSPGVAIDTAGGSVSDVGAISHNGGVDNDRDAADGDRIVEFTWTDIGDATGYDVQVFETVQGQADSYSAGKTVGALANGANTGISSVTLDTAAGTTTFSFTAPADGRKYQIQVKGYDGATGARSSNWSISAQIAVDITAPAAGSVVDPGTYTTSTTVTFTWSGFTDTGFGIEYYEVQSSDDNTNWSAAQVVGADTYVSTAGYGTETFENGETVYLQVRATDKAGNQTGWIKSDGITIDTSAAIGNVGSISDNGGTDQDRDFNDGTAVVDFTWTDLTAAEGYVIQVYETTGSVSDSYTALKNAGAQSNGVNTGITGVSLTTTSGTTKFQFTGADGKQYYIQVKAYTGADQSATWSVSREILVDITKPAAGSVSDPVSSYNYVNFTWSAYSDAGSGIAYFEVASSDDNTNWSTEQNVGTALEVTTSGYGTETFDDGETVYLRVRAVDNAGNISAWAQSDGITIDTSGGTGIGNVGTISDNGGADDDRDAVDASRVVQFTWTDLGTATQYIINVNESVNAQSDSYTDSKTAGALANGTNTGITAVSLNTSGGITTFQFTAPADNRRYSIQVKASDGTNQSPDWAVSSEILVDISAPTAGTVLDPGTASGSQFIYFTWSGYSDTGTGIAYYQIASSDDGTNYSSWQNVGTSTSISIMGFGTETFDNGETVYLKVRAVDNAGNAGVEATSDGILINTSTPPSIADVGAISIPSNTTSDAYHNIAEGITITYQWANVDNAQGYKIEVDQTTNWVTDTYTANIPPDGSTYTLSDGANTGIFNVSITRSGSNIQFSFSGVNDKEFRIEVKAYDTVGTQSSNWTSSVTLEFDQGTPNVGSPDINFLEDRGGPRMRINFNAGSDTETYIGYYVFEFTGGGKTATLKMFTKSNGDLDDTIAEIVSDPDDLIKDDQIASWRDKTGTTLEIEVDFMISISTDITLRILVGDAAGNESAYSTGSTVTLTP